MTRAGGGRRPLADRGRASRDSQPPLLGVTVAAGAPPASRSGARTPERARGTQMERATHISSGCAERGAARFVSIVPVARVRPVTCGVFLVAIDKGRERARERARGRDLDWRRRRRDTGDRAEERTARGARRSCRSRAARCGRAREQQDGRLRAELGEVRRCCCGGGAHCCQPGRPACSVGACVSECVCLMCVGRGGRCRAGGAGRVRPPALRRPAASYRGVSNELLVASGAGGAASRVAQRDRPGRI
jgi:hypothetical protein